MLCSRKFGPVPVCKHSKEEPTRPDLLTQEVDSTTNLSGTFREYISYEIWYEIGTRRQWKLRNVRADASRKGHSLCKAQVRISKTESEPWWASLSAFVVIWCYPSYPCLKYSVKNSGIITFSFFLHMTQLFFCAFPGVCVMDFIWLGRIGENNYFHPGNAQFPLSCHSEYWLSCLPIAFEV